MRFCFSLEIEKTGNKYHFRWRPMYRILLSLLRKEYPSLWRNITNGLLISLIVGYFSHFHPLLTPAAAFVGAALKSLRYWRYWWRPALLLAVVIVGISGLQGFHILSLPLAALCGASLPYGEWFRRLWRFHRHTRKFKKIQGEDVVVRWSPDLPTTVDVEKFLQSCGMAI